MAAPVRLLELLGCLSLACDTADGFAPETTLRSAVLAAEVCRIVGAHDRVGEVVVGSLLRHIGCTGFAAEEARRYGAGDDVTLRQVMAAVDFARPDDAVARIRSGIGAGAPAPERDAAIGALLGEGPVAAAAHDAAQCDAAERLAALLPVPPAARAVASHAFERWDGGGGPQGLAGEELELVPRVVEVGYVTELFLQREGVEGARAALAAKAGRHLDPTLAAAALDHLGTLAELRRGTATAPWDAVLDAEPEPHLRVSAARARDVALALARFTDLKSPFFTGHSEAVARLARAAAPAVGADPDLVDLAGLTHDVGRVGIATGTWELPRALAPPERQRVEGHSTETSRILGGVGMFATVAPIAGAAHERLDGGGYHRGVGAVVLSPEQRVLAAADVAVALGEARPHRPALDADARLGVLREESAAGRLDTAAVRAVLDAGGQPIAVRVEWPAGLSDREVEVLRLVAGGASNKDVARELGISARTVAHHVDHVYTKVGCRSRAGATLFALDAGLVGPGAARS